MRTSIAGVGLALSTVVLSCLTTTIDARGQSTVEIREQMRAQQREAAAREARTRELERAMNEVSRSNRPNGDVLLPLPQRKMTAEHKRLLFPSTEEREAFAAFLRQPHTGMVRLVTHSNCSNDPRLLYAGGSSSACLDTVPPVPGGGSFYSFRSGGHQWGPRADVWLRDGVFRAGFAGESLGIFTALGDVPLEAVTLASAGVDYLAEFSPPTSLAAAQRQYEQNHSGFRVRNHVYGAAMRVRPGMTYVLRSITYKVNSEQSKMRKPADVLVSFRVVSRAADGSVTLVWKELQRRKSPKIKIETARHNGQDK